MLKFLLLFIIELLIINKWIFIIIYLLHFYKYLTFLLYYSPIGDLENLILIMTQESLFVFISLIEIILQTLLVLSVDLFYYFINVWWEHLKLIIDYNRNKFDVILILLYNTDLFINKFLNQLFKQFVSLALQKLFPVLFLLLIKVNNVE